MSDDIQSAARLARLIELARGIHHGIALGDAFGHPRTGAVGPVGVATQLTLATTEGIIRTLERAGQQRDHDWGHENLEALRRWAMGQRIGGVPASRGTARDLLGQVPAYAVRRGSAPATVRVLRHGTPALTAAGQRSLGAHALVRTLPFAVLVTFHGIQVVPAIHEVAGTTHAHPFAGPVAVAGALLGTRGQDRTTPLDSAWLAVVEGLPAEPTTVKSRLGSAIMAAVTSPRRPEQLALLAPDRSAMSVLAAAVYAVLSHPEPEELPLALALAAFSPDNRSTSAVVGGLLGARWGSTPMAEHGAARLELAWACDSLATDLAMTAVLTPLAKEPDGESWLPSWEARHPV